MRAHVIAAVAQWIRRLPTEQEIHGSSPCSGKISFLFLKCVRLAKFMFREHEYKHKKNILRHRNL